MSLSMASHTSKYLLDDLPSTTVSGLSSAISLNKAFLLMITYDGQGGFAFVRLWACSLISSDLRSILIFSAIRKST